MPGISRTPTLSQIQSFTRKPATIGPKRELKEPTQVAQQLLKAQDTIGQDGQIQQNEIKTLDGIQLSEGAQKAGLGQILGQQITDFKQVAQFAADTQEGIEGKQFATPQAFQKKFTEITGKIDAARSKIQAFNKLAQASSSKGFSPQESKLLSLQRKLAQKELKVLNQLLNKFVGDFDKLSPAQVTKKLAERGLDLKKPQIRSQLLQAKGISPAVIAKINANPNAANNVNLNTALLTLNAQGVQRLNENPEILNAFANLQQQIQEGFTEFGKGNPTELLNNLGQEFASFLETGNAQGLYFAASARPSSPAIGRVLLAKSGIGELAKKIALEEQIKPFQDSAALLKASNKSFDFGTVNGKKVSLSGKDLTGDNFLKTIASTAAQIGIEPEDFARFIRFQLLSHPNQTDFVFDTPEKRIAFRDDVVKFTQKPPAARDQILADSSNLLNNLKELGEAPLKFVNADPDDGNKAGLGRHDANPAKIKESLNKVFDENEPLSERAAAFGDLIKVYKGFTERFDAGDITDKDSKEYKLFQSLRSKLQGVFFDKNGQPRDYGKQIDALAGVLGGVANVNTVIQNFKVLAQGDSPFKFEAIPGSNSVKITQGAADILKPGDKVKINGKEFTVDKIDSSKNSLSFKEPLTLKQGEFKLELSFVDKAIKGIEIVTKTADIAETLYKAKESYDAAKSFFKKAKDPAKQLAELKEIRKVAVENSQKLYKSTVNAVDKIKDSITAAVKDPKLAERIRKTVDNLKDALHALSPKASKSFFETLSKSPSLLKRFVDFAKTVDKKIGLDRLNKGLKYAYKTLRGAKAEDLAKATSAAEKGGVSVATKAQSRIPILGILANAGVTALDIKTFVDDFNAGKDNFTNFNNVVAIVSDVAAFAPGLGQSISLVLDSYGAGIAVGTLINEKGGIKQAFLEKVDKKLGIDTQSLSNDTKYALLRNQGIIGNGEELIRNSIDGSGKAILRSLDGDTLRFREMILASIESDVKSGAISKSEALLLKRNVQNSITEIEFGKQNLGPKISDQDIFNQIQEDLANNKISQAEALLFQRAVLRSSMQPQVTISNDPNRPDGNDFTQGLSDEPQSITLQIDEAKPETPQQPTIQQPSIDVGTTQAPAPVQVDGIRIDTGATGVTGPVNLNTIPLQPPINNPGQVTITPDISTDSGDTTIVINTPPETPTQTEDDVQIKIVPPRNAAVPVEVTQKQIQDAIDALEIKVNAEPNPIKKAFLQRRLDKARYYLNNGTPGEAKLNPQRV